MFYVHNVFRIIVASQLRRISLRVNGQYSTGISVASIGFVLGKARCRASGEGIALCHLASKP